LVPDAFRCRYAQPCVVPYCGFPSRIFTDADEGKAFVIVPSIVLEEIIYIAENKQGAVKFGELLKKIEGNSNYIVYDLNTEILVEMENCKRLKDLHDRIIVATARLTHAKLITKDDTIINSGYAETVWQLKSTNALYFLLCPQP
jgi:predicted nucleic acid-binding protein